MAVIWWQVNSAIGYCEYIMHSTLEYLNKANNSRSEGRGNLWQSTFSKCTINPDKKSGNVGLNNYTLNQIEPTVAKYTFLMAHRHSPAKAMC